MNTFKNIPRLTCLLLILSCGSALLGEVALKMEKEEFKLGKIEVIKKLPSEKITYPCGVTKTVGKSLFRCFCGNEFITINTFVNTGRTKSCGCYMIHQIKKKNTRHGDTRVGQKSRLHNIWCQIKRRCTDPKSISYHNYGGRGITICEEWLVYENFRDWALSNGHDKTLTIDRIDNDKGYSPDNCRWTTKLIQSINRRPKKNLTGFPGVYVQRKKMGLRYFAIITIKNKDLRLGTFDTPEEAHQAYVTAKEKRDKEYLTELEKQNKNGRI